MSKEVLVISDIHGRGDEFKLLIRRILRYIDRYKIILLGDYIGYGKNNLEVIRMLNYLKNNSDCIILKGNWEDMFYSYVRYKKSTDEVIQSKIKAFIHRGGVNSANEIFSNRAALNYYMDLIETMPSYHIENINDDDYVFAHSGIELYKEEVTNYYDLLDAQNDFDLLWNFNFYEEIEDYSIILEDLPFKIVAGHVPTANILQIKENENIFCFEDKVIGVDFGASKSKGSLGFVNISREGLPCIFEKVIKK